MNMSLERSPEYIIKKDKTTVSKHIYGLLFFLKTAHCSMLNRSGKEEVKKDD